MYCRPPLKKSYVSGPGHTPLLGSTVGIIGWKKQLKCGQGIKLELCICCHTSKSNRLDKNIGWWASGGVSTTMGWSRGSCLMPSGDQEDVLSGDENRTSLWCGGDNPCPFFLPLGSWTPSLAVDLIEKLRCLAGSGRGGQTCSWNARHRSHTGGQTGHLGTQLLGMVGK